MSYKTLLVHAETSAACDQRVRLAVEVAAMFDAKVIGLSAEGVFPLGVEAYAVADGALMEAIRERVAEDGPIAKQRFCGLTKSVAAGVGWTTGYDYPAVELARHACGADLIVASRPPKGGTAAFSAPAADLILTSGTPVLFASDTPQTFSAANIVVAWKNTREARRAIADAMPFLRRAQKVTLVAVSENNDEDVVRRELACVADRLARREIQADCLLLPNMRRPIAESLEQTANRLSADLIVMGGYAHSRFREWMLGGATEDMLATCCKFVLFSH